VNPQAARRLVCTLASTEETRLIEHLPPGPVRSTFRDYRLPGVTSGSHIIQPPKAIIIIIIIIIIYRRRPVRDYLIHRQQLLLLTRRLIKQKYYMYNNMHECYIIV